MIRRARGEGSPRAGTAADSNAKGCAAQQSRRCDAALRPSDRLGPQGRFHGAFTLLLRDRPPHRLRPLLETGLRGTIRTKRHAAVAGMVVSGAAPPP